MSSYPPGWTSGRPPPPKRSKVFNSPPLNPTTTSEKRSQESRPDFLVDVTIPQAHREVTLQSLAAGVPVLGEKPMSVSMSDAREMVGA